MWPFMSKIPIVFNVAPCIENVAHYIDNYIINAAPYL